jgi:hypothetical protein
MPSITLSVATVADVTRISTALANPNVSNPRIKPAGMTDSDFIKQSIADFIKGEVRAYERTKSIATATATAVGNLASDVDIS